ncbi:MAG: type II secretion system protein [Patescibacteria group bacterium]
MKLNIQNGFTLTEVIVVISITGILALISFPVLRNFQPTLQLNSMVRDLVSNLRLTQQLAVSEQIEYCFVLPDNFPSNREYQIIQCGETQFFKQGFIPEDVIGLTIDPSLSNNEVRYNSYGAVKESAQITIENVENRTKTIDVRPSGFIRIID